MNSHQFKMYEPNIRAFATKTTDMLLLASPCLSTCDILRIAERILMTFVTYSVSAADVI
jgi:hypothetical protein